MKLILNMIESKGAVVFFLIDIQTHLDLLELTISILKLFN